MPSQNNLYDIQQRVIELYTQAERHFLKRFKRPYIRLDLRGESAGQAWLQKYQLRFNPVLLKENREHFLRQTVAHEVAHLLTYELFGPKAQAHGKEWQAIMTDVYALPADRCHTYNTQNSSRKPWLYQCRCEGKLVALSTIRHNRSRKGVVYLCTSCKKPLKFVKNASMFTP